MDEGEEFDARLNEVEEIVQHASSLLESGDAVLINHFREIICYTCDIVRYLDCEYEPTLMYAIASMAIGLSQSNEKLWNKYIEDQADVANGRILEKENPEGRMDS
jgi:hypothetical protein